MSLYLSDAEFVSETDAIAAPRRAASTFQPAAANVRHDTPRSLLREWESRAQQAPDPRPPLELARTTIERLEMEKGILESQQRWLEEKLRRFEQGAQEKFEPENGKHSLAAVRSPQMRSTASSVSTEHWGDFSFSSNSDEQPNSNFTGVFDANDKEPEFLIRQSRREQQQQKQKQQQQQPQQQQHQQHAPVQTVGVPRRHDSARCCEQCQRDARAAARKAHEFASHTLSLQAELIESHATILRLLTERQAALQMSHMTLDTQHDSLEEPTRSIHRNSQYRRNEQKTWQENDLDFQLQLSARPPEQQAPVRQQTHDQRQAAQRHEKNTDMHTSDRVHRFDRLDGSQFQLQAQQEGRVDGRHILVGPQVVEDEHPDKKLPPSTARSTIATAATDPPFASRSTGSPTISSSDMLSSDFESVDLSEGETMGRINFPKQEPNAKNGRMEFDRSYNTVAETSKTRVRMLEQERQKLKAELGLDSSVVDI